MSTGLCMVYKLAVVFVFDGIRTVGRYAPRKWALGHASHSVLLGLCNGRQDHLGLALPANTYL
ncbi:hypothetical protein CNEO4_600054 [Clostridium neonatale]|nr:hypothetical protein CNEO4_600054 [Clostridium neonatale]